MKLLGEVVTVVSTPEALSDASVAELVTTVVNVCTEVRCMTLHKFPSVKYEKKTCSGFSHLGLILFNAGN